MILTDFNNDRAVDLAVTGDGPAPILYINPREGKYPQQPLYDEKLPPTTGIAVLDYNKDGWMDIAVTHDGEPGLTLWRNVAGPDSMGRRFERVDLPLQGALRGWGVTPSTSITMAGSIWPRSSKPMPARRCACCAIAATAPLRM